MVSGETRLILGFGGSFPLPKDERTGLREWCCLCYPSVSSPMPIRNQSSWDAKEVQAIPFLLLRFRVDGSS